MSIGCLLHLSGKKMVLEIKDYGQGIGDETIVGGNGLQNVRNRANELGAQLNIESIPGNGTSVRLTLPVQKLPQFPGLMAMLGYLALFIRKGAEQRLPKRSLG